MKVTALRAFAHDAYRAEKGEELEMHDQAAADLAKLGFVRAKKAPEPQNKMAETPKNKAK